MKISNLRIKNKYINYGNLNFDFSKYGIYKICGENGTGKTSIIEAILFGKYNVEFKNKDSLLIRKKKRTSLFTYIPQNIVDNDLAVYEYIAKENVSVDYNETIELLNKFSFSQEILKSKFKTLSGGEKKKIQIISAILKGGKYIFIDEPSNNLDDESTVILGNIIKELSKDRTIIMISHDDRLNIKANREYHIDGKNMIEKNDNVSKCLENNESPANIAKNYFKIARKLVFNSTHFLTIFLVVLTFLFIESYIYANYSNEVNTDEVISENLIFVEGIDEYDEGYYENYLKTEKVTISNDNKSRYFTLNDVDELCSTKGVKELYIVDFEYCDNLNSMILDNTISNSINIASLPEFYSEVYNFSRIDIGMSLESGRFPKDGANELVISKKLLTKYFSYTESNVVNAIGDSISLDVNGVSKKYEIVGFNAYDYIQISYEKSLNYGVYCFDTNSFQEFGDNLISYQQSIDTKVGKINEMVIVTNDDYEREIVNYVLENYPATYITSNYIDGIWIRNYNNSIFTKFLIIDVIISVIMATVFFLINKKTISYNRKLIVEFENYYIDRKHIKTLYRGLALTLYFLIFLAVLLANFFLEYTSILNAYLITSFVIIILPLIFSYFGISEHRMKK